MPRVRHQVRPLRGWQFWRRSWWRRPALQVLALAPALLTGGWMISSAPHDLQATGAHPCAAGETHCLVAFAGRLSGPYPHGYGHLDQ